MSEILAERKKLELPDTSRKIVRLLYEKGELTQDEISKQLDLAISTVSTHLKRLQEMGIVQSKLKGGKYYYSLSENVEVDEEGNVYIETAEETEEERLQKLLDEVNAPTSQKRRRLIVEIWKNLAPHEKTPENLFNLLVSFGVRRDTARWIVKTLYGTDPLGYYYPYPPYMTPMPGSAPFPKPQGAVPAPSAPPGMPAPWYSQPHDRELIRLEMQIERLMEEIRNLKQQQQQPQHAYPVVRRIKTDEQGRPIEIIEEPVVPGMARSNDETLMRLVMEMQKQRYEDREMFMKMIYEERQQFREALVQLTNGLKEVIDKVQQSLIELDKSRQEELYKLREEIHQREKEWMKQMYERDIQELQQSIQGLKSYYEEQTKKILEDLKKELEWQKRLEEATKRASTFERIRDEVIDTARSIREEIRSDLREVKDLLKQYLEQQMKMNMMYMRQTVVPEVTPEEKKEFLKKLRKKLKKAETKPETTETKQTEEIKVTEVGEESSGGSS